MSEGVLRTERIVLRMWRERDLDAFASLNADPEVMRWLGGPQTRAASDSLAERFRSTTDPFSFWALELPGEADFIGFTGLQIPRFEAAFTPCVEVGWRLARPYWGRGYATEAARESLRFGFEEQALDEIVSFTVVDNHRSRRVMERLGMREDVEFDHPVLPRGHPLERHVLYRLSRSDWSSGSV